MEYTRSRTLFSLVVLAAVLGEHHARGKDAQTPLTLVTDKTLAGEAVTGKAMRMVLTPDGTHIKMQFEAPYYEGKVNRVHLFLADTNHHISELEITPVDSTLRMYWAPYNVLRTVAPGSDTFEVFTTLNAAAKQWSGTARLPQALLPSSIALVNAANVHPGPGADGDLQYDTLYSITNAGLALPDLMVLPRYREIGPRYFFDNDGGYSKEWAAPS